MTINSSKSSHFETLPTEISCIIIDLLLLWDVKYLSCTCKSVREACMPSLFRYVEIPFSTDGFNNLKRLINRDACYYIISFTYVVLELLKAEILDFDCFKYDFLTFDSYVEIAKEIYDGGGGADEYPLYMIIYESLHDVCEKQRSIVDNGIDLSVLSSTFGTLPRLTESSRNRGAAINTISLLGFNLPYYYAWELDMCCMTVKYNALEDFLETNRRSLRSIGFYDVIVTESSRLESLSELSSDMLCKMMKVSQSSSCRAADCRCLPFQKEGWRMVLNSDDYPQRSEI
ncbi:hypothetical protein BKA65DRAFT_531191 [Rhexocercosporidium sp. MPI-PUGE-AT-0058]|nr:hypothetical protein BKA65DRAFT_531191 [Rhexocercosporidium sp. MPI-PUGE-AT-0058]